MVSLKTAFMVHGVVGFLFCLPIAFGGLKGFLAMMAEPEVVTWDNGTWRSPASTSSRTS